MYTIYKTMAFPLAISYTHLPIGFRSNNSQDSYSSKLNRNDCDFLSEIRLQGKIIGSTPVYLLCQCDGTGIATTVYYYVLLLPKKCTPISFLCRNNGLLFSLLYCFRRCCWISSQRGFCWPASNPHYY